MKCFVLGSALLLSLTACGTATDDVKDEKTPVEESAEESIKEPAEEPEVEEELEDEGVDLSLYDEVIDLYTSHTEAEFEEDNFLDIYEGNAWSVFLYNEDHIEDYYFTYCDIDENDVEELIISLKTNDGTYFIVDMYTIVEDEVFRLTNDENYLTMLGNRSSLNIYEDGSFHHQVAAGLQQGVTLFEFNEEKTNLVETYTTSNEEDDFEELSGNRENMMDLQELDWTMIGKKKEISLAKHFENGNFSHIEGVWKNDSGDEFEIKDNQVVHTDGYAIEMSYYGEGENDDTISINVMNPGEMGGYVMMFYPENTPVNNHEGPLESDTTRERITAGHDFPQDSAEIFYRQED